MSSKSKRIAGGREISHEDAQWEMATVAGSGGAKGNSPGGQSAEEDKDTLQSRAYARVLDVVSEGPIEGWVHPDNPLRDIYLDNTPIENPDTLGGWGLQHDGHTVTGSAVLEIPHDLFPLGPQGKPWKSEIVGRWIVGDFIPWGTQVVSVETKRKLTMSQAATGGNGTGNFNQDWKLGGTLNFKNFEFQFRNGTQGQGYMNGFPAAENTVAVSVQVTKKENPGPWTHQFGDPNLDAIRIDIRYPMLQEQDKTSGDIHGTSVQIRMLVNGREVVNPTDGYLGGKSSGPYIRTYKLELANIPPLPGGGWEVRVERLSDDSADQAIKNETWVDSFTEVIYGKLRYPNTAYVGLKMDSRHFSQIPVRAYMIKGLKVKIPSNYDPIARTYDETPPWDGTFAAGLVWTNNPAWCFYDMCINNRYGLGHFLIEAGIDKWTLYQIGKYCDQQVPNGKGGWEPRFSCNLFIQKHEDAIKVLQDMAGIFRGMLSYYNGAVLPVQDAPTDPSAYRMFSPANVVNGQFSYSGTGMRARHNVAIVSWSDLNDAGRVKQEYVEDHDGITKQGGITQLEITGFGCTSRAQARRIGLWAIYAEKILTDTVSFITGMEGYFLKPGQLIQVQDPFRAGATYSGRLQGAASTNIRLFLDRSVILQSGHTYVVSLLDPATGLLVTKAVTQAAGTWSDITVASFGFAPGPDADSVWQIADNTAGGTLKPELFRVFAMTQKDEASIEVTALEYNQSLYGFVDFDHPLEEPPISILPGAAQTSPPLPPFYAVTIQVFKPDNTIRQDLELQWTATADRFLRNYIVYWRINGGNWHSIPDLDVINARIRDAQPGNYDLQVFAVNTLGVRSNPLERSFTVLTPPTKVTGIAGLQIFGGNVYVNGRVIFQTRDAHFTWRGSTGSGNGPDFFPEGPIGGDLPDAMARGFKVRIFNDDDQLWEEDTASSEYTYTHDRNVMQTEQRYGPGSGALRIFTIKVYVIFTDNSLSNPATLIVENPRPPAPVNVVTTVGNGYKAFQWGLPGAPDIDHFSLFASLDPNDPEPPVVAEFHGTSGIYYPPTVQNFYYWLGTVDTFGNVSSNVPQGPPPGGTVLPPKFSPVGGTYPNPVNVKITEDTIGCQITYALAPIGQPATQWFVYGGPVHIAVDSTLYALATEDIPPFETAMKQANYYISSNGGPPPDGDPPPPWTDVDVGTGQAAGHTDFTGADGKFMVWGAGTIGGTTDKFHFCKQAPGAGDWFLRVKLQDMGTGTTQAGLMWRLSLDANAPYVSILRRATTGFVEMVFRSAAGGAGALIASTFHTCPVWLRLRRVGTTIYADYGDDGVNFINLGSVTKSGLVYMGMAVGSGVAGTLNDGQFKNVSFSSPAPPPPQIPPNDDFADAIVLNGNAGAIVGSTVNASAEAGEPAPPVESVWYKWTTAAAWDAMLTTGTDWNLIRIYTGTAVNALTLITTSNGTPNAAKWRAVAGTTYYIRIYKNTRTSDFNLAWTLQNPAPPNDPFSAAQVITTGNGLVDGTTVNATTETGEPAPATTNSVWFKWTAPATRDTFFHVAPQTDCKLDAYTNHGTPPVVAACDVVSYTPPLTGDTEGWVVWTATAGVTYWIRVSKRSGGATTAFRLRWAQLVPPPNDAFATPTLIPTATVGTIYQGGPVPGTTLGATRQTGEPPGDNSVWYQWTGTGYWLGVWAGSDHFQIEVYTGSAVNALTLVATSNQGIAWFRSVAGTVYRIRVMSYGFGEALNFWWYTPICATPQFDPPGGYFALDFLSRLDVHLYTTTPNAWLYVAYGRDPSPTDYDEQIPRTSFHYEWGEGHYDIRAMAHLDGWLDSGIGSEAYEIEMMLGPPCATPVFTPPSGTLAERFPLAVRIDVAEPTSAIIKYTTNGQIPGRAGPGNICFPGGTIQMPQPGFLKAVSYQRGREESPVVIAGYRLSGRTPAPTFNPGPGQFQAFPLSVVVCVPDQPGIKMRYTTDGTVPSDTNGTLIDGYKGLANIDKPGTTLKAIAYGDGYIQSTATVGIFTGKVATPTHDPDSLFYDPSTNSLPVSINAVAPPGLTVNARYTLDGKTPDRNNGTLLTTFPATVIISGGYRELRTIAFVQQATPTGIGIGGQGGYQDSEIKLSVYDFLIILPPPAP